MLKNLILFIIVVSIFYGAYLFFNQFISNARRNAEESISVPQIGVIMKGAKGLQKKSEDNVKKYDDPSYDE